jgi:integrative and conjugative element protein (TIGR02256 family)
VLKRCWAERAALKDVLAEARRWPLRETGGALLGWRDDGEVVVSRILGPGHRAKHRFSSFEPDTVWQGERGREIYAESGRTIAYVGDWHTHPRGAPIPSRQDRKTMKVISEDEDFRARNPLSMIVGRPWRDAVRRRHTFIIYVWDGSHLAPIDVEVFDAAEST